MRFSDARGLAAGGTDTSGPGRLALRLAITLLTVAGIPVGLREVANANSFQLFGDAVARVPSAGPVVALTFDDGPHPIHTPTVLDVLERHGVKATFFMLGRNVERHRDVARAVLDRGHEIGNHSYSHTRLVFVSPARVQEEVARTDQLLREIGVSGDIHFRAPHLSKLIVLPWALRRMNKLSVLADVDPEEWRRRPASEMTPEVLRRIRNGSIVMMHDTAGPETVRMLDAVITELRRRGFAFDTVSGLFARARQESGTGPRG